LSTDTLFSGIPNSFSCRIILKRQNFLEYGGWKVGKLKLIASGSRASETMTPGKYRVRCLDSEIKQRGRYSQVILTFMVAEEAWNDGTELKQWYNVKAGSTVSPHSKYAKAWELAAGREIRAGDDLDPAIFKGKVFEAFVGYSSQGEAGAFDSDHTETKKGPKDFLRVHRLENLIDHMGSYEAINTGGGGGGGGERSISIKTSS
jgi:hypothetical protein